MKLFDFLFVFIFAILSCRADSDFLDTAKKMAQDSAQKTHDLAVAAGRSVSEKATEAGQILSENLKVLNEEACKGIDEQTCKAKEFAAEKYDSAKIIAESAKEKIIKTTAAGLDASKGFVEGATEAIKDQAAYVQASAKHGLDAAKRLLEQSGEDAKTKYVEVTDKAVHDAESVQHSAESLARRLSHSVHDNVESARHVAEDIVHGVEHEVDHLKQVTHDAIEYSQEHALLDMDVLKPPESNPLEAVIGHAKMVGEKVTEHAKGVAGKVKEFLTVQMGL